MNKLRRLLVLVRWFRVCMARPGLVNTVRDAQAKWRRFMDNPYGEFNEIVSPLKRTEDGPTADDFAAELGHKNTGPTT